MGDCGRISLRRTVAALPEWCALNRVGLIALLAIGLLIALITLTAPKASEAMSDSPPHDYTSLLQAIVQQDEGGRGIGALVHPGALATAAQTLLDAPEHGSVLVLSGFPCNRERSPPGETDGPPGQVALAYTLLGLGRQVTLLDEHHHRKALELQVDQSRNTPQVYDPPRSFSKNKKESRDPHVSNIHVTCPTCHDPSDPMFPRCHSRLFLCR